MDKAIFLAVILALAILVLGVILLALRLKQADPFVHVWQNVLNSLFIRIEQYS
jgi:hypothetical protein